MVFSIGVLATLLGLLILITSSRLGETVLEASAVWIAVSSVVAPIFFVGMLSRRCNARHALVGIMLGWGATLLMVLWYITSRIRGNPISFLYVQVPGTLLVIGYGLLAPLVFGQHPPRQKIENLTYWTFDKRTLAE
jgi:Na+/proline symporter